MKVGCNNCIFRSEWEKIGKLLSVVLEKQAEQEPKTGHWIDTNDDGFMFHRIYKCSHCGNTVCEYPEGIQKCKWCFNCGAKMVEPQESEAEEE